MSQLWGRRALTTLILGTSCALATQARAINTNAEVGNLEGDVQVEQGNLSYTVPIATPSGINGIQPGLSITYKQGGSNSPLGMGISLQGLSAISRCGASKEIDGVIAPVRYTNEDKYCLDGKRLVLVSGTAGSSGAVYKPVNGANTKIIAQSATGYGPSSWKIYSEDGTILEYGTTADSLIKGKNDVRSTWYVTSMQDRYSNSMNYSYNNVGYSTYINKIKYNNHEIAFNYSNGRSDAQTVYRYGQKYTIDTLLNSITISSNNQVRNTYKFSFEENTTYRGLRLKEITYCGKNNACLNPLVFHYAKNMANNSLTPPLRPNETEFATEEERQVWNKHLVELQLSDAEIAGSNSELPLDPSEHGLITPVAIGDYVNSYVNGDVNNDGLVDFCFASSKDNAGDNTLKCALGEGQGRFKQATTWGSLSRGFRSDENLANLMLVDLNNDRWTDYCITNGDAGLYCAMNDKSGNGFGALSKRAPIKEDDTYSLVDINKDEYVDICVFTNEDTTCYLNNKNGFTTTGTTLATSGWQVNKYIGINSDYFSSLGSQYIKDHTYRLPAPQLVDANNDGNLDVCGIQANGHFSCQYGLPSISGEMPTFESTQSYSGNLVGNTKDSINELTRTFRYSDLNADSLPEVCYLDNKDYVCHTNNGDGFESATVVKADAKIGEEDYVHFIDRNNDNQADLCVATVGTTEAEGEMHITCAMQEYMAFGEYKHFETIFPKATRYEDTRKVYGNFVRKIFGLSTRVHIVSLGMNYGPLKQVGDVSGDGIQDTCYVSTESINCITPSYEPLARLTGVTNSYGVDSTFEYSPLLGGLYTSETHADDKVHEVLLDRLVVSAIRSDNGIGEESSVSFRYQGYQVHEDDGSLGFRVIEKKNHTTGIRSRTEYAQTDDLRGKPLHSRQYLDSKLLKESTIHYTLQKSSEHDKIKRILVDRQTNTAYNYETGNTIINETKSSNFNQYGKPGTVVATVTDGSSNAKKTTTTNTTYWHNTDKWLLNKPIEISVNHQLTGAPARNRSTKLVYNQETGSLISEVFEPGSSHERVSKFTYDSHGNKNTVTIEADGQKRITRTSYDSYGRVTSNTNALGHSESFTYDAACNATKTQTGPNGLTTTLQYDDLCRLTKTTHPDGQFATSVTEWTSAGEANAGIDFQGLGVPVGDRSIYKTTTQDSAGAWKTTFYDKLGREVRTVSIGQETEYENKKEIRNIITDRVYNARGALHAVTLPYYEGRFPGDIAHWVRYEYDELGRTTSVTQPNDAGSPRVTTTAYNGYQTTETRPDGSQKTVTTDFMDNTVRVEEGGITITYTYDAIGNLLNTDTDGFVIKLEYDSIGKNKLAMTDPTMGRWTYEYNGFDELVKQTDSKKQVSTMVYDALGRKTSQNDHGEKTTWVYDTQWKGALSNQQNSQSRTDYTYDSLGRVSSQAQKIGDEVVTKTFDYDQQGRVKKVNYPEMSLVNSYDSAGNLKTIGAAKNELWTYEYIQLEEQLKKTISYIGELQSKATDYEDQIHQLTLRSEVYRKRAEYYITVEKRYDGYAKRYQDYSYKLEKVAVRYQGYANQYRAKARYYYRYLGNMVLKLQKVKNGRAYYSKSWCTKKDWKGRCKRRDARSATLPAWMVQQRVYRCTYYWKGGKSCGYKTITQQNVSPTKLYNNRADYYQRVANRYKGYTSKYRGYASYYKSIATRYAGYSKSALDTAKRLSREASWASNTLEEIIDELDHQKNVATGLSEQIQAYQQDDSIWTFWRVTSRDASGRLEGELYGNGMNTKRIFDAYTGDLLRIKTGVAKDLIRDIRYTYNQRSSVTQRLDAIKNIEENFQYDRLDRLTHWSYLNPQGANHERDYRYDNQGNMTFKTGAGSMQYDAGNRLVSRTTEAGKKLTYSYDANGSMINGDDRTYHWSTFNKASAITAAGGVTRYSYDGDHNRVKKTHKGVTTLYFGKDYEVILETDKDNRKVRRMRHHIFAGNELVATHEKTLIDEEKQADSTAYVHRDALGSVDTVTDEGGRIVQQQRYTPFGEDLDVVDDNKYRKDEIRGFTGHENVGETGLINMNARLYDPVIGRFVQADTMIPEPGNVQSYNRYVYVINNPMKYNDPDGHFWQFIIGLGLYLFSMTTDDPFLQKITSLAGMAMMGNALHLAGFSAVQNGAMLGFISGTAQGGIEAGIKQAAIGGLTAGLTSGVADAVGHGFSFQSVAAQMVVGGIVSEIRGGKFIHGAASALAGKVGGAVSTNIFGAMGTGSQSDLFGRTAVSMMFGGLAAEATGGSFEDGAMQGLFTHLFNDEASDGSNLFSSARDFASYLPVVGSGLDAYDSFSKGNIGMGFLNLGLMALDLTGTGALVKGITVGTMKYAARRQIRNSYKNTNSWNAMRRSLQRSGNVATNSRRTPRRDWTTTDHVFIKQRYGLSHRLTNHPANLQTGVSQSLNSSFEHMGAIQRAAHLPGWMQWSAAGSISYGTGLAVGSGD